MTECGEKDLTSHDEDIFCVKESLPLFPSLWMAINFRTHSFRMCNSISFNYIPLLKNKMHQRHHKYTNFLLVISHLFSRTTFIPAARLTLSCTKISLIKRQAIKVFP